MLLHLNTHHTTKLERHQRVGKTPKLGLATTFANPQTFAFKDIPLCEELLLFANPQVFIFKGLAVPASGWSPNRAVEVPPSCFHHTCLPFPISHLTCCFITSSLCVPVFHQPANMETRCVSITVGSVPCTVPATQKVLSQSLLSNP